MDDNRLGLGIRAARVRRGWRQVDLARASRVAATTISRVERGAMDGVSLRTLRTITGALEMRIDLRLRSRDGDVERLISGRHAALAEAVIGWIRGFDGWIARPEVSFNVFGERGSVDLVAWHQASRALVVIELKTEIVDVGETIATFDRKVRLAGRIAGELEWHPARVGAALVIAGSATNRRRVDVHLATFRSTFPDGIVALRAWLRTPAVAAPSALRALAFFSDNHHRNVRSSYASIRRVRRPIRTGSERGASVAGGPHRASRSGAAP